MNASDLVTTLTTVFALALALGMGAALLLHVREERRRSAARIAALVEAADLTPDAAPVDLDPRPAGDVAGISGLFAVPERSSPWGRRLGIAAGVAAIGLAAGYVLLSRDATMAEVSATRTAAVQPAPLELLSLRHAQQADSLTITGLVHNPRTGEALSRVTATAILFSADGALLASGRAPLDFSTIGPGDESPFVVKVPVTAPVARYRVGFRGADGRVIAHVDRRASGTMALRN